MGKRQSNASGLARFLSVLQDTATSTDAVVGATTAAKSPSETIAAPPSGSLKRPAPSRDRSHAAKRRKVAILDGDLARYDASGLAHHYTDASQVPEHLQKCASCNIHRSCNADIPERRLFSEASVLYSILRRMLAGRSGLV
jgi:hypothetical protein